MPRKPLKVISKRVPIGKTLEKIYKESETLVLFVVSSKYTNGLLPLTLKAVTLIVWAVEEFGLIVKFEEFKLTLKVGSTAY